MITIMMMAWSSMAVLRRAPVAMAFSMAGSTRSVVAVAAASSRGARSSATTPFLARRTTLPFFGQQQQQQQQNRGIGSMVRQSTAAVENDLETKLGVSHAAYEIVEKDVVSEYGAYCTLYKHKKSGAELLSVSSDDDNKVRQPFFICFVF